MQWLILYSHQNDDVLAEWQLLRWKQKRWSSSRSIGTKYKNELFLYKGSHAHYFKVPVDIHEKRQK